MHCSRISTFVLTTLAAAVLSLPNDSAAQEPSQTALTVTAVSVTANKPIQSGSSQQAALAQPDSAAKEPKANVRAKVRTVAMELLNSNGKRPVTKFGLEFDPSIDFSQTDRPTVIVIHGHNSCPERMAAIQKAVRDAGYRCGAFRYPNDQGISDSAALLSQELAAFKQQHPSQKLALVTHSMGALVAREAIENPERDHGNVAQLIMIAPPSHGTSCAGISFSGDIWDRSVRSHEHNLLDFLYASFEDGMGESRTDLMPDSVFLKQLNARPLSNHVRYTVFLGTGTPFTRAELDHARQVLEKCCQADSFVAVLKPAFERAIADFDDCIEAGDGVVSVARGRLEGVTDTQLLGFDHWSALSEPKSEPVAALHREILKRLAEQK